MKTCSTIRKNIAKLFTHKTIAFLFISFFLALFCSKTYALAYSITPKPGSPLPTQVMTGKTVKAFYVVTNNTRRFLPNGFVKYLPPSVTQVTSKNTYPRSCAKYFNLGPQKSCILELLVSGSVNAANPNPRHHLFVCASNAPACAGTNYPLNVRLKNNEIVVTSPYAYFTEFLGNTVQVCQVNGSGELVNCSTTGSGFSGPYSIAFNPSKSFAYITNRLADSVFRCKVNKTSGALTECVGTGSGFSSPAGIAIDSKGKFAFIANSTSQSVLRCAIDALTGDLSGCSPTGDTQFKGAQMITLNSTNTYAYVSLADPQLAANEVDRCEMTASTGVLNNCIPTGSGFNQPIGIALNTKNNVAYVANSDNNFSSISRCIIQPSTGDFNNCAITGAGYIFDEPLGIALNAANSFAYIANSNQGEIVLCKINPLNGELASCAPTGPSGLALPLGITLVDL